MISVSLQFLFFFSFGLKIEFNLMRWQISLLRRASLIFLIGLSAYLNTKLAGIDIDGKKIKYQRIIHFQGQILIIHIGALAIILIILLLTMDLVTISQLINSRNEKSFRTDAMAIQMLQLLCNFIFHCQLDMPKK